MQKNDFSRVIKNESIALQDPRNEGWPAERLQHQSILFEDRGNLDPKPRTLRNIVNSVGENPVGPHIVSYAGAFDHDPVSALFDALDVVLTIVLARPKSA